MIPQFLLYNLAASVASGLLVLGVVLAGIRVFRIRHGALRSCLMTAPLIKSTLVLLGLTLLVSWPRDLFLNMRRAAVQPEIVVPLFLGFGVLALGARFVWMRRSRALALRDTMSAEEASPRLVQSLDRVMSAYRENDARIIGVCPGAPPGRPKLLLTDRSISPFVATASEAAIVFPRQLVATLSDQELDGVLAHELAHLRLRRPAWCASENVQLLSMLNPMAIFMASQLHREEEKACDDIAVAAVGNPDVYAAMLVKSYRFARQSPQSVMIRLQALPQLIGGQPLVSERVERLVEEPAPHERVGVQYISAMAVWAGLVTVFFVS